ncbi:quercetin dioxygenase-like cupin family protein [Rhizobium pisi]|uniref:Quercetin dioxygenase-like cupin family protein n=1 Tax=Rhizobium pisi TaxID=574561 RepID=A0A7W5G2I0_9HYPH|nr:quercetin dioxygenase-like cupin family protein [Rhizobium pisi]
MSTFRNAVVSLPGRERIAKTPFGAKIVIDATAAETGGAFGMLETFTPPGQGPAPHTHTRETEVFRVIHGLYRFQCGDEEFDAPPGTVVVLPPQVRHSWRNISDQSGQMFGTVSPGGCEQLLSTLKLLVPTRPRKLQ